jgi:hypothetical protein
MVKNNTWCYEQLGVYRGVNINGICRKYKQLSKTLFNQIIECSKTGDEKKRENLEREFRNLVTATVTLSNLEKKLQYDETGKIEKPTKSEIIYLYESPFPSKGHHPIVPHSKWFGTNSDDKNYYTDGDFNGIDHMFLDNMEHLRKKQGIIKSTHEIYTVKRTDSSFYDCLSCDIVLNIHNKQTLFTIIGGTPTLDLFVRHGGLRRDIGMDLKRGEEKEKFDKEFTKCHSELKGKNCLAYFVPLVDTTPYILGLDYESFKLDF